MWAASAQGYTLRWADNSADESGFRVERAGADLVFALIATVDADVTTYNDSSAQPGTVYFYRVLAFNSAGTTDYSNVAKPGAAPTITTIPDQNTVTNVAVGPVAFGIADPDTPAEVLTVSGSSSNPTLVPNSGITFGGSGSSRTVTVSPATGQTGTTSISVTVSDGERTARTSFLLTVTAGNSAPTISQIPDQIVLRGSGVGPLPFTIGDAQTPAASLVLSATSSDTKLIPLSGITFGGSGANRTVTVRPVANRIGTVTVAITVSDGSLTAREPFRVLVQPIRVGSDPSEPTEGAAATGTEDAAVTQVVIAGEAATGDTFELTRLGEASATDPLSVSTSVEGSPKVILVRAIGPGLAAIGVTETAAAPRIRIVDATGGVVHESGAWGGDPDVVAAAARLGKLPLEPRSADAAALVTLRPGVYTAQAIGTGVMLLEVAEVGSAEPGAPGSAITRRLR